MSPQTTSTRKRRGLRRLASLIIAPALLGPLFIGAVAATEAEAATKTPNVKKLAGDLAKQKLTWEQCDFGTEALNERFNQPNVSCATVVVPKDWHNPDNGETWNIRISQAKNREVTDGRYQGTIFANPGGPGGSGLIWGPAMQERTPDLNPYYNYVGFDPRGVGDSSHAVCYPEVPDGASAAEQAKAIGDACSTNADVKTISTEQTAYDMDFIRYLLKAPKLDYIGYSYGTWLGSWYSKVFGANAGKVVLDSALDATEPTLQPGWYDAQPKARDRQFEMRLMNYIARHDDTYGLGTDAGEIYDSYLESSAALDELTLTLLWLFSGAYQAFPDNDYYPQAAAFVQVVVTFETSEDETTAKAARAATSDAEEDPAALADELLASLGDDDARDTLSVLRQTEEQTKSKRAAVEAQPYDSAFDFIRCNDGQWTQGANYWTKQNEKGAKKYPISAQLGIFAEIPACAYWRTNTVMPVADPETYPETIVVQAEMDSQTAWEAGRVSGTELPNTSFIAVDNEGSHGLFPYGTECTDRPIYNFFLKDKLPADIKVCQGLPLKVTGEDGELVPEDQTYENWGKLNKKAKHTFGPAGPFDPASTAKRTSSADEAGQQLLTQAETDPLVRAQIQRLYGQAGVEAMEKEGLLLPSGS
ncbi:alpha/beta fold hydrolase [Naumannella halotolerans]|uniref:TAP-like protein n=1 Tax=Naumannella halotolerans TaxID=993414 RepID=A0A4R7J3H6_9ACTN|nr:alpha/beta hydrolase [Naumannella halotolerans]TDT31056.1 TAP-like protein [Naumannella halotolerans]